MEHEKQLTNVAKRDLVLSLTNSIAQGLQLVDDGGRADWEIKHTNRLIPPITSNVYVSKAEVTEPWLSETQRQPVNVHECTVYVGDPMAWDADEGMYNSSFRVKFKITVEIIEETYLEGVDAQEQEGI